MCELIKVCVVMTFNQPVTSCAADAFYAPLRRLLLFCDGGIRV